MGNTDQPSNDFHKGQNRTHCSWLFQCWRPEKSDAEERSDSFRNKNSKASISPTDGTGHQERRANQLAESEQPVPPVSDGGEATATAGPVEEDGVDKDAEKFIDKMRRKMNMEALKSMKRYESMLHRGY